MVTLIIIIKEHEARKGVMEMALRAKKVIDALARELNLPGEAILEEGLKSFLEKKLRSIKAEIFQIAGKYGVSSVEEMEALYRRGVLEEEGSLDDYHRLDHLEYKKERLEEILEELR
ncbi:MAG: hypothetical protein QHH75_09585 [Bacillota bacterium]|nr:hypothetical protein [Bacillota bacterium]